MLPLLEDQIVHLHRPIGLLHPVPLQVHASYTREEILAAFGASTVTKPLPLQTGVYWHEPTRTDLLFITLQKSDQDYSPTTRYLDYAISERLFHWESQAKDTVASDRGQNYLHHQARDRKVALFIRLAKNNTAGRTMPYFCAGTATYVEHQSDVRSRSPGSSTTRFPATSSPTSVQRLRRLSAALAIAGTPKRSLSLSFVRP